MSQCHNGGTYDNLSGLLNPVIISRSGLTFISLFGMGVPTESEKTTLASSTYDIRLHTTTISASDMRILTPVYVDNSKVVMSWFKVYTSSFRTAPDETSIDLFSNRDILIFKGSMILLVYDDPLYTICLILVKDTDDDSRNLSCTSSDSARSEDTHSLTRFVFIWLSMYVVSDRYADSSIKGTSTSVIDRDVTVSPDV